MSDVTTVYLTNTAEQHRRSVMGAHPEERFAFQLVKRSDKQLVAILDRITSDKQWFRENGIRALRS